MTKQKLKSEIEKISKMGKQELISYTQKIHMVKQDLNKKAFEFLVMAADAQMMNLCENTTLNAMAVMSEISMDDEV